MKHAVGDADTSYANEFETGNPSMGIQPPDRTMYYLLIWFFVFSFILFIVNSLMYTKMAVYKTGDR